MMRLKKIVLSLSLIGFSGVLLSVTGCTPDTQKVMSSVPYTTPISAEISAPATLIWEPGTIQNGQKPTNDVAGASGGIIGMAESFALNSTEKTLHPSWFEYSYGLGQQAVFATSLRDVLQQNQVFSQFNFDETLNSKTKVETFRQNHPDAALIQLQFMDTSATVTDEKTQLFADVDLTLSGAHRPTTVTHLSAMTAEDKSWVIHESFLAQEKELSDQLMKQAVKAIEAWVQLTPRAAS